MPINILQDVEVSLATPQGATLVHAFKAGVLTAVDDELKPFIEHLLRTGHAVEEKVLELLGRNEKPADAPAPVESAPAPVESPAPSAAPEPSQEKK